MASAKSVFLDGLTVLTALAALMVGWSVLTDGGANGPTAREIEDFDELAATGYRLGAVDPELTVLVWIDYECPVCRSVDPQIDQLLEQNPDQVAVVYRSWPLDYHAAAYPAAVAVDCAATQGLFKPYHDRLLEEDAWLSGPYDEWFSRFADDVGLDANRFEECRRSGGVDNARIQADVRAAQAIEARGTPAIVVNGVYLDRVPPDSELSSWVRAARR